MQGVEGQTKKIDLKCGMRKGTQKGPSGGVKDRKNISSFPLNVCKQQGQRNINPKGRRHKCSWGEGDLGR